eukprot:1543658-Amphidinium_carterae.2
MFSASTSSTVESTVKESLPSTAAQTAHTRRGLEPLSSATTGDKIASQEILAEVREAPLPYACLAPFLHA